MHGPTCVFWANLTPFSLQHPGYFNMPDMLSVGQGSQTQAQYRAQMLLWSVLGAPLILGDLKLGTICAIGTQPRAEFRQAP